ncbi:MAG: hypothetical protein ACOX0A_10830 [Thermoguttaceae bacterium]
MHSILTRRSRFGILLAVASIAVVATSLAGCTTRRQYAINESILISERRQLEDEIYRVQFELRDALEENARLRARLDAEPDYGAPQRSNGTRPQNRTAPTYERPSTPTDDNFFPGGEALRATNADLRRYYDAQRSETPTLDMREISELPDFAFVSDREPESAPNARNVAPPPRLATYRSAASSSGVSQAAYYEEPLEEYVEETQEDEEYGTIENNDDEYGDDLVGEEWSPTA